MMKAVVLESYGSPEVLKVTSIPVPSPKKNEVLVKIHATAVNTGDVRVRRADPFLIRLMYGLFKPGRTTIPGMEVSGTVVAVGEEVSDFQPGDEVFGSTGWRLGGYAQYRCFPDHGKLIRKPGNCSFEEAAAVTVGGNTALYYLRDKLGLPTAKKHPFSILIYGASGSVGTIAVQLASLFGWQVTGVCSQVNVELIKSLGATEVLDYQGKRWKMLTKRYDCVFDAVGKLARNQSRNLLKPGGKYLTVNRGLARGSMENLIELRDLMAGKKINVVIDRIFDLEEAAEAHRYVEQGHKRGNVILQLNTRPGHSG